MKDQEHPGRPASGYSRREFLRGSSAAAAATALATGTGLAAAKDEPKKSAVASPGLHYIILNVNGRDHSVKVEPRMTLLEVLRYQLGLTGAKPVSADG